MPKIETNLHKHTYDEYGHMTCCSLEEKINAKSDLAKKAKDKHDSHDHDKHSHEEHDHDVHSGHDHGNHDHDHDHDDQSWTSIFISLGLLISGLLLEYVLKSDFFKSWLKIIWYAAAYIPVGLPVIKEAFAALKQGEIFTEFFLMTIATIGAFAIGEYPEGVAVMLFYAVGEWFQIAAVKKSKKNIESLLDVRPNTAFVFREGGYISTDPERIDIGEKIQVRVGEKVALDGKLLTVKGVFNTAALTGESKPQTFVLGDTVMSGSINLDGVIDIEVTKTYENSSIARILELVQNASKRKSKTELLIRRLAKIYTPIVVYMAIAIVAIPFFIVEDYQFADWLYRALIFLVISCPCALVISIPLGYFGGLGAASKNGILFKGAMYLDQITKMNTLVMDKTGTLTKGVFKIKDILTTDGLSDDELMSFLQPLEAKSTHPIGKALMEYNSDVSISEATNVIEISGMGLRGDVANRNVMVGNDKLMLEYGIEFPSEISDIVETTVIVAVDNKYAGCVVISDELKEDAKVAVSRFNKLGLDLMMLSGDKDTITKKIASEVGIENAMGGLLPENKLSEIEQLKTNAKVVVGFVGDGINDAPVLAGSDIGFAMGGLGSDVAIETADVIIQTDQPGKIATAIEIGKSTQKIIWQNIAMAFGVKGIVLIMGAFGVATMWEAVFADVGVALLAILNAVRLQRMEWE